MVFGGWLLRITRNAAINRQAKEQRSRPVDDIGLAVIEATGASPSNAPAGFGVEARLSRLDDPAAVAEQSDLQQLVWSAVGALGERDAEVLDLQLRYGMSPAEIGEIIGINRNAANQLVHRVRGRFETAVRARVLWRGERAACDVLADLLVAAGVAGFDADAVRIADRHAPTCAACSERRDLHLQPAALFAAVLIIAAPILFKQQAASAMEAAGVPMQGSSFSGASTGSVGSSGPPVRVGRRVRRRQPSGQDRGDSGDRAGGDRRCPSAGWRPRPTSPRVSDRRPTRRWPRPGPIPPITTTTLPATTSTTPAVSTSTTSSATTTTLTEPLMASLSLSAATMSSNGGTPPTLSWSVTGPGDYSVAVTGFVIEGTRTVPATTPTGSGPVCPGTLTRDQCVPSARQPAYDYVFTVIAPDGTVLLSRTVTLTRT